jgi:RNA polymerase sigma factor (sigma-70 family)
MLTAKLSDAELVVASEADPNAFGQVFDRHAKTVFRFAWRRVGDELAKDITAETFSIAFEHRSNFDPERGTVLPWLLGIATNVIRNHRRAERRFLRAETANFDVEHDDLDDRLDAAAARAALVRSLSALTAEDRDALLLFAWTPLNYEGVAQALGIPVGTVGSRLSRARRILRAELSRAGWPDEPDTERE